MAQGVVFPHSWDMVASRLSLTGFVLVEMIGIEPIVTEVGGFTVPCHTITAASPLNTLFPMCVLKHSKILRLPVLKECFNTL